MGNILRFLLSPWTTRVDPKPEQIHFIQLAFQAAKEGDVRALQQLMEEPSCTGGMPLQEVVDPLTGWSLLHVAMEKGSKECVQFLIGIGCDVAKGDKSGETPLHVASMNDKLENLMAALEADLEVDLDITDMWRRTLLLKAIIYNSERVLQFLLNQNVNLNAQDIFSYSVMHIAVTRDRLDLVRELTRRGANLNLRTERGLSPLSVAITSLNPRMVKELLVLGARTHFSRPPLPSITAIREFIHHCEGGTVCQQSEEILHLMLAAHGFLLRSGEPNVFQRVLCTAGMDRFLPLLHKTLVCSDTLCDDLEMALPPPHVDGNGGRKLCTALKLFDLARRSARAALMASGHNVLWAAERLSCVAGVPPAVKGLLLLKDCDFKDFPFQN